MLKIGNVCVDSLVKEFKTPLYVYDETMILKQISDYQNYFVSKRFETEIIYASKALDIKYMYYLANKMNLGIDVVSGGELYGAYIAKCNMAKVYLHGNNKTPEEIEMAINYQVGTIVIDNLMELNYLEKLDLKNPINVLLRINVGVSAHTHDYIVTAHPDSKFGIYIEDEEVNEAMAILKKSKNLVFKGIHCHIGSQIFDLKGYLLTIDKMFDLIQKYPCEQLNLGGGIGVSYTEKDQPITIKDASSLLIKSIEEAMDSKKVSIKKVMIEPGRSIVANAGYTLYTIGYIKKTKNKLYYFIDGGMTDNIRPSLYQAEYDCDIANRMHEMKTELVSIAGKACESSDVIIKNVMLPKAEPNDILVVYTTGAYGHAMSSNYNQVCKLPVIFIKGDEIKLVEKRQAYDNLYELSCYKEE